jgi:hypothetical protein
MMTTRALGVGNNFKQAVEVATAEQGAAAEKAAAAAQ